MPHQNRFRHQPYAAWKIVPITTSVVAVRSEQTADIDVGQTLRSLRFGHVILVHGTFVGSDPFGLAQKLDEFADSVPSMWRPLVKTIAMESWGRVLRSVNQKFGDRVIGETGSFRDDYLEELRSLLRTEEIKVDRFDWSSGNDHVARSEAAVMLFNRLVDLPSDAARDQILLWGHSHAGNVFALLTNLLANDRAAVAAFFEAAAPLMERREEWQKARDRLAVSASPHPLAKRLCLVTFGTPVRYGWDKDGYRRLLHIVHHRPTNPAGEWLAKPALPQVIDEILAAKHGDWVQSLGIAGTDLTPVDRATREIHRKLGELLESGLVEPELATPNAVLDHLPQSVRTRIQTQLKDFLVLLERWNCGPRVHLDGNAAWLLDYGEEEKAMFGHGVYTKRSWLPFHATRIADWLRHELES